MSEAEGLLPNYASIERREAAREAARQAARQAAQQVAGQAGNQHGRSDSAAPDQGGYRA